jgi:hypothetical protein
MTTSMTRSASFTITDARQIASKMGADLRNLNTRTGHPRLTDIPDYVEEAAQYLKAGYLESVSFGFKSGDEWKLRLRYQALAGGNLSDGAPGGLPNLEVTAFTFYSYLRTNSAFDALTSEQRRAFKATLPVDRTPADEPSAYEGITSNNATYARNGLGLGRDIYRAS